MIAVDAAQEQVHRKEAALVAAFDFDLQFGDPTFIVFDIVAEQHGGLGIGLANGPNGAAGALHHAAQDGHVANPLARLCGGQKPKCATEQLAARISGSLQGVQLWIRCR